MMRSLAALGQTMNDFSPMPLFVSAIYLRMSGFERLPVIEQARLRGQLDTTVKAALIAIDRAARIVLDTPDGFAVLVLGSADEALALAQRCLAAADHPLCIGINHGVVAATFENGVVAGFLGDGLNAARVAARSVSPSQILVTRSLRDALAAENPTREAEFTAAGVYSDASMRTHELFKLNAEGARRRRNRLLAISLACSAGIVAGSFALRGKLHLAAAPAPHATLLFDISPGGDVLVDGQPRGSVPPLDHLDIPVGSHTLEIRHAPNPPLRRTLDAMADEQIVIQYDFGKNKPPNLLHRLKKKLGFEQ